MIDSEPGQCTGVDCEVCGRWPSALHQAMRSAVNALPLKGHVCDNCFEAFGENIAAKDGAKGQRPS